MPTIKFLETTPSENPDFPFQPGQVIRVSKLSPSLRKAIQAHQALLLKDEPERAITAPPETR
jgi:hypothetical protein